MVPFILQSISNTLLATGRHLGLGFLFELFASGPMCFVLILSIVGSWPLQAYAQQRLAPPLKAKEQLAHG